MTNSYHAAPHSARSLGEGRHQGTALGWETGKRLHAITAPIGPEQVPVDPEQVVIPLKATCTCTRVRAPCSVLSCKVA